MPILANIYILANADLEDGMKEFSSTDLANKTGDVLAAAAQSPVSIARHGKPRFVVLSAEVFDLLKREKSTRRAVHVSDLDDEGASSLVAALTESIESD